MLRLPIGKSLQGAVARMDGSEAREGAESYSSRRERAPGRDR